MSDSDTYYDDIEIETTLIITYDGFGFENDCVDIVYINGTYFSLATPW